MINLRNVTTFDQFNQLCKTLSPYIGPWGGRRLVRISNERLMLNEGTICINDLVRKVDELAFCTDQTAKLNEALENIGRLDMQAQFVYIITPRFFRNFFTLFKKIFGNFPYNRQAVTEKLQDIVLNAPRLNAPPLLMTPIEEPTA